MVGRLGQCFPESAVMVVEVQKITFIVIIGDINVSPSFSVDIAGSRAEPEIEAASVDLGLIIDICKMPAVIAVQAVAELRMSFCPQFIRVEERIEEHVGMIDHEHIQVPVMIEVKKGYGGGIGPRSIESVFFRALGKGGDTVLHSVVDI